MWGLLRIILLIVTAGFFALAVYSVATKGGSHDPTWLAYGVFTFLALNFIYLLLGNRPSNWRISRLIGLWIDAKESELRQRADRSRQDK
jgi:hypothetical protein